MILLCGGTGLLGSHIATHLAELGIETRALVRPQTDATTLEALGMEIARGDLRDRDSLRRALTGIDTVISTATSIGRTLSGESGLTIRDVDVEGYASLIAEAESAGVKRFIYLSGGGAGREAGTPLSNAKLATERRLAESPMRTVTVCPDAFEEVWLSPAAQFDWSAGSVTIFGRGRSRVAYVAVDDVARAVVKLARHPDPPAVVSLGGPEMITPEEAVRAFASAAGRPISVRHIPRPVLSVASLVLRRIKPATASIIGMALASDSADSTLGPEMFEELGIEPSRVSEYIGRVAAPSGEPASAPAAAG
jgi:uncharacterized protein YbjT (DUF2867 family)